MAGDWIKMRTDLDDDPAVILISERTGLREAFVVGLLWKFWRWCDQQLLDGNAPCVTVAWLDRYVGVNGFAQAMIEAGWLDQNGFADKGFHVPNFERHNGQTAKKRALAAKRAARHRHKESNAPSVTKSAPREEKRRYKQNAKHSACSEPDQAGSEPPLLTFPTVGKTKDWHLDQAKLTELGAAFPLVDVLAECRKALAWMQASPARRKTARGMGRFLFGWLSRCVDRGGNPSAGGSGQVRRETIGEKIDRLWQEAECPKSTLDGPSGTPPPSA